MGKYFWAKDIKTTPTAFFYEYQEMRKAHRLINEKLEFLAGVLVRKYELPEAVRKYERYTQKRTDEWYDYDEVGFVESETDVKVATVTLKREYFDWKDFTPEKQYWIEVWVCDELKEFIGDYNESY